MVAIPGRVCVWGHMLMRTCLHMTREPTLFITLKPSPIAESTLILLCTHANVYMRVCLFVVYMILLCTHANVYMRVCLFVCVFVVGSG